MVSAVNNTFQIFPSLSSFIPQAIDSNVVVNVDRISSRGSFRIPAHQPLKVRVEDLIFMIILQLDVRARGSGKMMLQPFSVDTVKGWTRCSAVAFISLAASSLDLSEADAQAKLTPLHRVLDKAWLIPMHVARLFIPIYIYICSK